MSDDQSSTWAVYSPYAQVCVRLSVVSNTNPISISDDIRILANEKARVNLQHLAGERLSFRDYHLWY
jgi:hypothetical protein